jgi:hypothetical protein
MPRRLTFPEPFENEVTTLTKTLGNGMVVSHTFDAAGRETVLANRTVSCASRLFPLALKPMAGELGLEKGLAVQEDGATL